MNKKYECPCCGYLTLDKKPPGTFDICPVCFWEDDDYQYYHPDYRGGANEMSLNEAKHNFAILGAIDKGYLNVVRKPLESEKKL